MIGLMKKDILVAQKTIRAYILFLLFYFGMAVMGMFSITFVTSFLSVLVMLLPMSAFAYDEQARWDRYAMSMPLGRRAVVGARYLFSLILALFASACGLLTCVLLFILEKGDLVENLSTILSSLGVGIWLAAILLPLCYKLGPERARPYMYVVIFVPIIALFLAYRAGVHIDLSFLDAMPEAVLIGITGLFPLAGLLALGVSYLISCGIVSRKEY